MAQHQYRLRDGSPMRRMYDALPRDWFTIREANAVVSGNNGQTTLSGLVARGLVYRDDREKPYKYLRLPESDAVTVSVPGQLPASTARTAYAPRVVEGGQHAGTLACYVTGCRAAPCVKAAKAAAQTLGIELDSLVKQR